jgi:hypothetical protein
MNQTDGKDEEAIGDEFFSFLSIFLPVGLHVIIYLTHSFFSIFNFNFSNFPCHFAP